MKFKMLHIATATVLSLTLLSGLEVMATNDNLSYRFEIPPYKGNGRDPNYKYRGTMHANNPWKAALVSTDEGPGTVTTFWLEARNGTNVSPVKDVQHGAGTYYTDAYKKASEINVWLTGENNNDNSQYYYVSGIWDEETW